MAINQQTVDDPVTLLSPPTADWREIYSASYALVADEAPDTLATVTGVEFYGFDLGAFALLGPDQVAALAPHFDDVIGRMIAAKGGVVYGTKVFWVLQASLTLPVVGTIAVDRYRYVVAHRDVAARVLT